jgi:branched-chain amino acid aminotransferase
MSFLSNLKLVASKKKQGISPVIQRRNKLSNKIFEQIQLAQAQKEGYDQILWTDPIEHKWIEETGTTNFFAVINDTIVTPALTQTLLAGITRDSVIKSLRHLGYKVEERPLSIDEIVTAHQNHEIKELFITGTAATLMNLDGFGHRGTYHEVLSNGDNQVSKTVKQFLDDLKVQRIADPFGWLSCI